MSIFEWLLQTGVTVYTFFFRLSQKIEDLEKKNDQRKEAKMETFKEQMKLKSLEKNIEQKNKDIDVLAKESKDLKERLNALCYHKLLADPEGGLGSRSSPP